jgi:uncharacterized radical SAM protein YgiQ
MDSMVAHYTPQKKLRRDDAYTPGNRHGARPNRATIVYTSCCKAAYKDVPVVIGGIEASLRRFAHYDYWDDKVRRSILPDSKADLLIYGMAERALLELSLRLREGERFEGIRDVRGSAFLSASPPAGPVRELPSWEEVAADPQAYAAAFRLAAESQIPLRPTTIAQRFGNRLLVCNPPALPLEQHELDSLYQLPFTRLPHPSYSEPIPAWEQIKSSITTHRGCYGGCAFCAIAHHQGKAIQSRSIDSIVREAQQLASHAWSRGTVSDLGGPTANMYGTGCARADGGRSCPRPSCLYPSICASLDADNLLAANLLKKIREVPEIRHVTVASGIRYDLLSRQPIYFEELLAHHIGGLLKVAPEHCSDTVLRLMRKPPAERFESFLKTFRERARKSGKQYGVVPYLMSGHPGTTLSDMLELALFMRRLGLKVEQVQEFTPTPGTMATCIYYTGFDPYNGEEVFTAKGDKEKRLQKALLLAHVPEERSRLLQALRLCGREDLFPLLTGVTQTAARHSKTERKGTLRIPKKTPSRINRKKS